MVSIRKFGAALVLAAVLAGGVGTASVEAASKKTSGDSQAAICAYLWDVMTYPYVSATVLAYATSLYYSYGCTQ